MAVERLVVVDRTAFLRRPDYRVVRALALVALVLLWEAVTRTGWVSSLFLPSPSGVLAEGLDMARSGQLLVHLGKSLQRLAWGFGVGALAGWGWAWRWDSSRWRRRWCSRSSRPRSRSPRSRCCRC